MAGLQIPEEHAKQIKLAETKIDELCSFKKTLMTDVEDIYEMVQRVE